jgi:hypothetical protein
MVRRFTPQRYFFVAILCLFLVFLLQGLGHFGGFVRRGPIEAFAVGFGGDYFGEFPIGLPLDSSDFNETHN